MSTTTETLVTTIGAQDKRALKHASGGISFRLDDRQAKIVAHRRGDDTASGFDEQHTIFTDYRLQDYGKESGTEYTCYYLHMYPLVDSTMMSLVNRIAVGDTLSLEWIANNDNDNYRSVGFHRDELRLVIGHKNGKAERYLVAVSVGPDNTARMIRRVR